MVDYVNVLDDLQIKQKSIRLFLCIWNLEKAKIGGGGRKYCFPLNAQGLFFNSSKIFLVYKCFCLYLSLTSCRCIHCKAVFWWCFLFCLLCRHKQEGWTTCGNNGESFMPSWNKGIPSDMIWVLCGLSDFSVQVSLKTIIFTLSITITYQLVSLWKGKRRAINSLMYVDDDIGMVGVELVYSITNVHCVFTVLSKRHNHTLFPSPDCC